MARIVNKIFYICLIFFWASAHVQGQALSPDSPQIVIHAIKEGDIATVKNLLKKEGDLSRWDLQSQKMAVLTALGDFGNSPNYDIVELLISQGAIVDCVDQHGETPLMYGIFWRLTSLIEVCLRKGAAINQRTPWGCNAVQFAARLGDMKILRRLLTSKADMKATDFNNETPLMMVAHRMNNDHRIGEKDDSTDCLRFVWERTKQDHPISRHEYSIALYNAVNAQNEENAAFLLAHGADASATDNLGRTALLAAIKHGDIDMVDLLLDMGAAVDIHDRNGVTPLSLAHSLENPVAEKIVRILQKHGAVETTNDHNSTGNLGNIKQSDESAKSALLAPAILSNPVRLQLLAQGAARKIGCYTPQLLPLSLSRPANVHLIPNNLNAPQYCKLIIGPKESPTSIVFLLYEPAGKDAKLWVDISGNGDLTHALPIIWNKRPYETKNGRLFVSYEGGVSVPLHFGGKTCTVHLGLIRFDKADLGRTAFADSLLCYCDYAYEGSIQLGDACYNMMISDDKLKGDFRFTPGIISGIRLLIDVNGDGKFDYIGETYDLGQPFNIRGNTYQITVTDASGETLHVGKSIRAVAEIPPTGSLGIGQRALVFQSETMDHHIIHFPDYYKGKVVMLDFWATWCSPCMDEMPNLVSVYQRYHDKGFEVLGISLDEKNAAKQIALVTHKQEMPWPQIYEGNGWKSNIAQIYDIHLIPNACLIDGDTGKILAVGRDLRGPALEKTVEEVLTRRAIK